MTAMNLRINPVSFRAKYAIVGPETPKTTQQQYNREIQKLKNQRDLALQAHAYMASPETQAMIKELPIHLTVIFNSTQPNGNTKAPCLDLVSCSNGEIQYIKEVRGDEFDHFDFSLGKDGKLNSEAANDWFDRLLSDVYNEAL